MRLVCPARAGSIDRLLTYLSGTVVTYVDVGASLTGRCPTGFRWDSYDTVLGHGAATFQRASFGLQHWQAHRGPAIRVWPADARVAVGTTVVVTLGTPLVALAAPCRVVEVIDEIDRWGFAYGTLPGHPEEGEEAFTVSISPDGTVRFEIAAFSRPGSPVVTLAGPIGRAAQRAGTKGYLRALRRAVDGGDG
jgi:uncharacterized protein (UPF0548 family)